MSVPLQAAQATPKRAARRARVREIGLKLITRRSKVRIHPPLSKERPNGRFFVSKGNSTGDELVTCGS